MKTRHRAVALAAVLTLVLAGSASAHFQEKTDDNDTKSRLDLGFVGLTHFRQHGVGWFAGPVCMRERWGNRLLAKPRNNIYVLFDSHGSKKFDYFVWIFYRNGHLVARVKEFVGDGSDFVGSGRVQRVSDTGGRCIFWRIRRTLVNPSDVFIRWAAFTSFRAGSYCTDTCFDSAPDSGAYKHPL